MGDLLARGARVEPPGCRMQGCLVPAAGVTHISDWSSINGVLTKITENDCKQQAVMEVACSCSQSSPGPLWLELAVPVAQKHC